MDIKEEKADFEADFRKTDFYKMNLVNCFCFINDRYVWDEIQAAWEMWQAAKAQAVPEGFVLVEKSKVRTWYQDDDEPENFCNSESDLDCFGDCLDHEDILQVNKIEDAIIQTTPMYGVWKFKIVGGQPERDCFVLCNTEEEAISIREEYRRMIDLEAQEQKG